MPRKTRPPKQPSAHRAVLYAIAMPGWGEYDAGSPVCGVLTLLLFLAATAVFTWQSWRLAMALVNIDQQTAMISAGGMGVGLLAMVMSWYWGQFNAAMLAQKARVEAGLPAQRSQAWAAFLSWVCPGCGHAYSEKIVFGIVLLAASGAGMALKGPAYVALWHGLRALAENPALLSVPITMVAKIQNLFTLLEYSIASVFLEATRILAISDAVYGLAQLPRDFSFDAPSSNDNEQPRAPWYNRVEVRFCGYMALGYVAPGAGQLMQNRSWGWLLTALYLTGQLGICVALTHGLVEVKMADTLSWGPTLVQAFAMLEAPITMARNKASSNA